MKHVSNIILVGLISTLNLAHASGLIGETLTFSRAYPTPSTPYWSPTTKSTTVATGESDLINWQWFPGGSGTTFINPEDSTISWSGSFSQYIADPSTFDGFIISGFSRDILSVSVTDYGGFTIDLSPSLRSFGINLSGFGSGFKIDVQLAPVPEPISVLLAAVGLFTLGISRSFPNKNMPQPTKHT